MDQLLTRHAILAVSPPYAINSVCGSQTHRAAKHFTASVTCDEDLSDEVCASL